MLGSLFAMPIVVINMGGEMIYILNQRLLAQKVPTDKAIQVLEDVVRTMFTPVFVEELFKPQDVYTHVSTKQIFEKLAHSSIMRLNKTSMDKLYDLMTMGLKQQLLSCAAPQQFLQITLKHLQSLQQVCSSESVLPLLAVATQRCVDLYTSLSEANWLALEQTLLQFMQGRRVKVSLFLQNQLQSLTGTLLLSNHKGRLPSRVERPGEIRYYENGSLVRSDYFVAEHAAQCEVSRSVLDVSTTLGNDMYTKESDSPETHSARPSAALLQAAKALDKQFLGESGSSPSLSPSPSAAAAAKFFAPTAGGAPRGSKYSTEVSAKAELSLLAGLLGVANSSSSGDSKRGEDKPFRINLFPTQGNGFGAKDVVGDADKAGEDEEYDEHGQNNLIVFDIDGAAGAKTVASYMDDLDLKDDADCKAGAKDDDDLLSLMDSAK